mmetsp:Transcript_7199/g.19509  ORF Transcript_7199/g.19509 Transcript_7199/m.19509 type:complete len:146 (+) Transcript_7199:84-521(+)
MGGYGIICIYLLYSVVETELGNFLRKSVFSFLVLCLRVVMNYGGDPPSPLGIFGVLRILANNCTEYELDRDRDGDPELDSVMRVAVDPSATWSAKSSSSIVLAAWSSAKVMISVSVEESDANDDAREMTAEHEFPVGLKIPSSCC